MLSYCFKCRKNTESKNSKIVRTKSGRTMLLSKCEVCGSKRSKFMKEQEASGLISSLGITAPLSKIPLYIYQNELDRACFQHDMAYGDFKDLTRKTVSDKISQDKEFNRYQQGLASMVYKFFDKKASGGAIKNKNMSNKETAEELTNQLLKKLKNKSTLTFYRQYLGLVLLICN